MKIVFILFRKFSPFYCNLTKKRLRIINKNIICIDFLVLITIGHCDRRSIPVITTTYAEQEMNETLVYDCSLDANNCGVKVYVNGMLSQDFDTVSFLKVDDNYKITDVSSISESLKS